MSDVIWEFHTARFAVKLHILPEHDDPAGHFASGDDEADAETVRKIEDGTYAWFCAKVGVYLDGREVGSDYLGACCYESTQEFATSHRDADPMNRNCSLMRAAKGGNVAICHYFPDMVRQAIADARRALGNVPHLRTYDSAA